jgi:muramidase (phage lysozyme)
MGGKTSTSTNQVTIPPEVLARYNSVNATAQQAAQTPFQQYSTDPNAFVAPLTQQQQVGISGINQYANTAQPAYNAAMQGTAQAFQGYNAPNYAAGVQGYMNPYLQNAMGATAAQLQNINQQQQQQLLGNTISQGAFGGDRGNIAQAALMNQQNLATGNVLANMANTGYQSAAQNYLAGLGQQGALANQFGNLGLGAQTAGLQGAQAQVGAGTLGQQTQQAGLSALYNQFQQQQAYPFQTAQFLANIAEGTGALSGSTTTTTQPMGIFGNLSDERAKENIEPIGKTFDGQNIYKFNYKGEPNAQVGLIAQDVERRNPDAVHEQGGLKYVDYDKATADAANRGHFYRGGITPSSMGGHVNENHMGEMYSRGGYALGGDPSDFSNDLSAQRDMYAPFSKSGIYGQSAGSLPGGGKGIVPTGSVPVHQLMMANPVRQQNDNAIQDAAMLARSGKELYGDYKDVKEMVSPTPTDLSKYPTAPAGTPMPTPRPDDLGIDAVPEYRGGIVRLHRDAGGDTPYNTDDPMEKVVESGEKTPTELKVAQAANNPSSGGLSNIFSLVGLGKDAIEAAPAIGSAMSGFGDALSALFLANGGIAREHHDGSDGNVVGDDTDQAGLDSKMQYKIAPQNLSDMDPIQQQVVKGIYSGESGGQYDILNGGEKFDPSQGHPHRIGKGGESTAAGAGQFLGSTWDQVTGGAPMTPAYQDAATWKLAQDDYAKRTGRDLRADVADQGFSPEIKAALAPTWTSLGEGKPSRQVAQQTPPTGIAGGQTNQPSLWDKLSSEDVILPILSGLGTMASSNSRFLLPALLQGIGGGAQTYMQLQKQQSEIAKNTLGLAQARFTPIGNGQYFDRMQGDTVPMQEYQRRLAQMPGMARYMGIAAPQTSTTGAPAAAAPQAGIAPTKAVATTAAPPVDQAVATAKDVTAAPAQPAVAQPAAAGQQTATQVSAQPDIVSSALAQAEANPQVVDLRKQADQYKSQIPQLQAQLDNATAQAYLPGMATQAAKYQAQLQYAREQFNSFTTRADALRTQIAQPVIDNAKAAATAEATERAKLIYGPQQKQAELQSGVITPELYKTNIATRTDAFKAAREATDASNQSKQMMDLMFDPQTQQAVINGGPLGETLANSAAVLKQAGFSDGFIKMFTGTNPADAQALEKLRTAMGSEIARQDLGPGNQVRQQEFLRFLNTTPGVQILPEAFRFINENMIQPKAKVAQGAYEKIASLDPTKDDLQNAYYLYERDNPWYKPAQTASPAQGGAQPAAAQQVSPEVRAAAQAELARRRAAQGAQ